MKSAATALIATAAVLFSQLNARAAPPTTNATLIWGPVDGAVVYTLYWGTSVGAYAFNGMCSADQTSLTASNILIDQFYYFSITASDSNATQSAYSPAVAYASPSGNLAFAAASDGSATATVTWNPVVGAVAYTLNWGTGSGAYTLSSNCPAPQTNLSVGLSPGQTYYFALSATDWMGNQSEMSPEAVYLVPASATPLPTNPPPANPTNSYSLTWNNPAAIVYGAALDSNQLDATASVPGSFAYTLPSETGLNAGTNVLSVVFTPADTADYGSITDTVDVVVWPAPLSVTAANATQAYGQPIPAFSGTFVGLTNGDNIAATYASVATNGSPAGAYPITAALVDPAFRQTNYTVDLISGTLTITPAIPQLTWTNPAAITYGTPLDTNSLDATSSVPGSFAYNPTNGVVVNSGTNALSVIFTPADALNYAIVTNTVNLVVTPAPLTVTVANATQTYGQPSPAFTGTIVGLTNGDNITATYVCGATNGSPAGIYPITAGLIDPASRETNYAVNLVSGTLKITPALVQLTWTNAAPIVYGTALGSNELNAVASVPGSFAYSPTNGAVLDSGTNALSVIFTPTDTVDYGVVTNTVSLFVSTSALVVTAADATQAYGQASPVFTGAIVGLTNGDYMTAGYNCGATSGSVVGTYPIVPTLADPYQRLTNYTITLVNGTLTVTPAFPQLTWADPAPIIYGAALGTNQLNAAVNAPGTFAYNPPAGTVFDVGTNVLFVVFTPADAVNYGVAAGTVSLVVSPAPLTVRADDFSRKYDAPNPVFTGAIIGLTNGDILTATYKCGATQSSPPGTYPITPSLADPFLRRSNYVITLADGALTIARPLDQQSFTNSSSGGYGVSVGSVPLGGASGAGLSIIFNRAGGVNDGGAATGLSPAVSPAPIALSIGPAGNSIVLIWNDPASAFTLQAAPALTGVFTNVPGAASPFTNPITGAQQFFRLIAH